MNKEETLKIVNNTFNYLNAYTSAPLSKVDNLLTAPIIKDVNLIIENINVKKIYISLLSLIFCNNI